MVKPHRKATPRGLDFKTPSQTTARKGREYFPSRPGPVAACTPDVDSGGWSLQRQPHTFGVVRNDGQIRFCGLIRLGAALLPIP